MGHSTLRRIPMALTDRNLTPGTQLVAKYKGETHTAAVVQTDDGLRYQLSDGRQFKSPSSAGTAVTGKSCNGWAFWSLANEANPSGTVTPAPKPGRPRKPRSEAKAESQVPVLPIVERLDDQFECGEC